MFEGSALKLSHPLVCSVFQNLLSLDPITTQSLEGEGLGGGHFHCSCLHTEVHFGTQAWVRGDFTLFVGNEAVMKHYIEFGFFQKIL